MGLGFSVEGVELKKSILSQIPVILAFKLPNKGQTCNWYGYWHVPGMHATNLAFVGSLVLRISQGGRLRMSLS